MSFKAANDSQGCPSDEIYNFVSDVYKLKVFDPLTAKDNLDRNNVRNKTPSQSVSNNGDNNDDEFITDFTNVHPDELINSLNFSRTQVSSQAREKIFHDLIFTFLNDRYSEYDLDDNHINILIKSLKDFSASDSEIFYNFKLLIVISILYIEDDLDIEFIVNELFTFIDFKILDVSNISADLRSNLIIGYFTLYLTVNEGSIIGDLDSNINRWLDISDKSFEVFLNNKNNKCEIKVIVAILHGISLLLSLSKDTVQTNEIIESLLPTVNLELLADNDPRIVLTSGQLVAQCFQSYDFDIIEEGEDDDDLPCPDKQEILGFLKMKSKDSNKKINKDLKKQIHQAFRSMSFTVENNLSINAKTDFLNSESKNPILSTLTIQNWNGKIDLNIKSWGIFARLDHLRWALGPKLVDSLFKNDGQLLNMLKNTNKLIKFDKFNNEDHDLDEVFDKLHSISLSGDKKKRDISISKARLHKQEELYGV